MTHGRVLRGLAGEVLGTAAAVLGLLGVPGCAGPSAISAAGNSGASILLSAQDAEALIASRAGANPGTNSTQADGQPGSAFVILDVRTPEEYAAGHIAGAVNVCVTCTSPAFSEALIGLDKNATYLVYCHSGNRSATAVSIMSGQGFTKLYELAGGTIAWQAAGLGLVQQ